MKRTKVGEQDTLYRPARRRLNSVPEFQVGIGLRAVAIEIIRKPPHAFRYRLNLTFGFFEATNVSGFNAYGGGFGTEGRIQPGTVTTVTMAGEYSLTRHWLLALDISYQTANATRFSGSPGVGLNGEPAQVGKGSSTLIGVAQAVEYIYNEHLGLIGGPWISVTGRNAAPFVGAVLAVYLFF